MKYLRSTLAWGLVGALWGLGTLALTGICILLAAPFLGGTRSFFGVGKWWARAVLWFCGATWSSEGWERVPEDIREGLRPAVFMSNHESHLDPPLLMGAIPVQAVYIAKSGVKWMPLVGWASWAGGVIFVDRSNSKKAAQSMARATEKVRRGKSVVIFPEGTRTRDGKVGIFKKGGFRLAVDAGVPIVPIATVGGWDILPKGALRSNPGCIKVIFGDTVYPDRYPSKEALMEEVERQIREMAASARPMGPRANSR